MKKKFSARDFAYTVVMAALVAVVTITVRIPNPIVGSPLDIGEVPAFFASWAFGPWVGMLADGIGATMGDLLGGYPFWAPITIVNRGIQGLIFSLGFRRNIYWKIGSAILGQLQAIFGYWIVWVIAYGWGAASAGAITGFWTAWFRILIGVPLYYAVIKAYPRLNPEK